MIAIQPKNQIDQNSNPNPNTNSHWVTRLIFILIGISTAVAILLLKSKAITANEETFSKLISFSMAFSEMEATKISTTKIPTTSKPEEKNYSKVPMVIPVPKNSTKTVKMKEVIEKAQIPNQSDPQLKAKYRQLYYNDPIFKKRRDLMQKTCSEIKNSSDFFMAQSVTKMLIHLPRDVNFGAVHWQTFAKTKQKVKQYEEVMKFLLKHSFVLEHGNDGFGNSESKTEILQLQQKFNSFDENTKIWHPFNNHYGSWKTDEHNWIFCIPPKTGTTNWQRSLVAGLDHVHNFSSNDMKQGKMLYAALTKMSNINNIQKTKRILFSDENIKIMNVRHPVDRLYSAWHDKFRRNMEFHQMGKLKDFLPKMTKRYFAPEGYLCSWPDFVSYWLNETDQNNYNYHWQTAIWQCLPCGYDYEFITKTETASDDSRKIMKVLFPEYDDERIEKLIIPPRYEWNETAHMKSKDVLMKSGEYQRMEEWKKKKRARIGRRKRKRSIFQTKEIPSDDPKWLPDDLKEKLRERLKWELKMFGYEY